MCVASVLPFKLDSMRHLSAVDGVMLRAMVQVRFGVPHWRNESHVFQ